MRTARTAEMNKSVGKVDGKKAVNMRKAAVSLGVSYSFCAALKKAAGIKSRLFFVKRLKQWWKENPNFKQADAYRKVEAAAQA